jgi:rhodanese-related sulfurtransferase
VRRFLLRQVLLLLALAFVPAIGQALYLRNRISWQSPVPASERVTVAQAKAWGTRALWIDARPDEQFVQEHFSGALLLNEDHFNQQLPNVLAAWSPDKKVVVYCSTKECGASRAIAERLRGEAQLKEVFVLEGGWEALQQAAKK